MLVLNETQIEAIQCLVRIGYSHKAIAKMFKVTEDDIKKIILKGEK